MSSWRSRFRRNKTPDSHETKTSSYSFSKTADDTDTHKKWRSRFLRRSKHEDDYTPRPQSMFIENSAPMSTISGYNPPTVQEILDKNRNFRQSSSKSPKSWRRLISGEKPERSPAVGRKYEDENRTYTQRARDYNSNSYASGARAVDPESRYGVERQRSLDSSSWKEQRSTKSDYSTDRKDDSTSRRISHIRRQKSMTVGDNEADDRIEERTRSDSPYDNVAQSGGSVGDSVVHSGGSERRERRPRSLYFEEKGEDGKPLTPRRERRAKANRAESQNAECTTEVAEKLTDTDSFVLRKPRAKYPVDDGDEEFKATKKEVKLTGGVGILGGRGHLLVL